MDIQETRRTNLKRWLEKHSIPPKEKSLFSQLKGDGSFGERVARRLERDYDMGEGFLDQPTGSKPANKDQNTDLSDEAKELIRWVERLDKAGGLAQQTLVHHSALLRFAVELTSVQDADVVTGLVEKRRLLESHEEQSRAPKHAPRKHK